MSLAEQVVVLAGTWVSKRKEFGRAELLECEQAPSLNNAAVVAEIGEKTPFNISVNDNGKRKHMAAIRVGRSLVVWEAAHAQL